MYSGEKLAKAVAEAIQMKGVRKSDVARHFGIKPPSVSGWVSHGRISKEHIDKLIEYFSDVVEPSHFGIQNMGLINAPSSNNQGTINNVAGDQNTNNFLGRETTEKETKAILGDKDAVFLTAMPELSIDDGVEYALNPAEKGVQIRASMQRSETFIPNSDMVFRIKIAEPILSGISPTPILQNDILVIEPRIPPRNQDLVLICLDYQQPMQRGMIARLTIGTDRSLFIKHSDEPAEPLPENALICGVVSDIQRHILSPDLVAARIDTNWNILNTLKTIG